MEETTDKLTGDLQSKKVQLHWLLQITKAINYNLPAEQLYQIYETVLHDHLKAGKLSLFVNENGWKQVLSYGMKEELGRLQPELFLNEISFSKSKTVVTPQWLEKDESVIPVYHNEILLAYCIVGAIDPSQSISIKEVVPFIHTITNIIVVAIENKRLNKEAVAQAGFRKELELAAEMQEMLFPTGLCGNEYFEIATHYLPHQQVGGDYYDFISLSKHEHIFCMADVSGKGMAAALLMSNFQANLHALIKNRPVLTNLVAELNDCVSKTAKGEKFITFFIGLINFKEGKINYVNAGHNPPVLFSKNKTVLLDRGTTGLGMFDELPFINEGHVIINNGDSVFCYTDGITELENLKGDFYGMEALKLFIEENMNNSSLDGFHKKLIAHLDQFREGNSFSDDVTILSLRSLC
ncbi:MAG: PP2C family protein-serine/threonine phosphatase [Bacteroidia bacterium]|jgi:sigma-B regulation protein RsbU (phosphoserine phosphatase)